MIARPCLVVVLRWRRAAVAGYDTIRQLTPLALSLRPSWVDAVAACVAHDISGAFLGWVDPDDGALLSTVDGW